MTQIGNVLDIIEVKQDLDQMKLNDIVRDWEIPYENLLTRRSVAVFFLTPSDEKKLSEIWNQLSKYEDFHYRENTEKILSNLDYRIEFK
ncbi:hypothetical protein SAMN02745163_02760 [Clostridium cavendishii DSM 21758]|uniref:Uncharacterized protein n=1 Tax=Clostridium cavendishii DSM 21758 TaxID=1121302 RepID=A0A1M6MTU1_9CLOT|nr:hypothetical protein [Clostridium cavendishii]SHJ86877.1 hypothetical protein SAMN02745163_02760 [Clostridium cavendishii DSM 21758]